MAAAADAELYETMRCPSASHGEQYLYRRVGSTEPQHCPLCGWAWAPIQEKTNEGTQ